MLIQFPRFKKKTLSLAYITSQRELVDTLKEIKYKKLFKCILKEEVFNITEQKIIDIDTSLSFVLKLSKTQILIGCGGICFSIKIFDISTGICLKTVEFGTNYFDCITKLSKTQILSGFKGNSIKIWDLSTFNCLKTLIGHNFPVTKIAKLNNTQIISGCYYTLKIWDLPTGSCLNSIKISNIPIEITKLSNNKILVAYINYGYLIQIYDYIKGNLVKNIRKQSSDTYSCATLSNSEIAFSIYNENSFIILNFVTEDIKTLNGHTNYVISFAKISKKLLASGSCDSIKIWDLTIGNCLKTIVDNCCKVGCIAKLNNYQIIIGNSFDNIIRIWDIYD